MASESPSHMCSQMVHSTTTGNLPWLLAAGLLPQGVPVPPLCHLHGTLHCHCPGAHLTLGLCVKDPVSRPCDTTFQGSNMALHSHPSSQIPKPCCALYRSRSNDPVLCSLTFGHLGTKPWPRLSKHLTETTSASLQPIFPQGIDMREWSGLRDQCQGKG